MFKLVDKILRIKIHWVLVSFKKSRIVLIGNSKDYETFRISGSRLNLIIEQILLGVTYTPKRRLKLELRINGRIIKEDIRLFTSKGEKDIRKYLNLNIL